MKSQSGLLFALAVILSGMLWESVSAAQNPDNAPKATGKVTPTKTENGKAVPNDSTENDTPTTSNDKSSSAASGGNSNAQSASRYVYVHPAGAKTNKDDSPTVKTPFSTVKTRSNRPHIVMIVADDLGWNDLSWMDKTMYSPELARLASEGVVLKQAYVQPVCSPSRTAFMSGYYPYHVGLQHNVLEATQKAYLPGNLITLPQHLKKLGYKTHMAGKWHLGFCNWRYTPTYRGFDSFVGYYNAVEGYYNHTGHADAYDFRHNEDVYYDANGTYSAYIFTDYIQQVIADHDASEPLFVYLPYQSVHGPTEVPQYYIDRYCSHVKNETRRIHCGMGAALDEGVGNVTRALKQKGMFNDTILLFTTDNGGPVPKGSNNWPLRGSKGTLWEGGTRGVAFLHGPKFFPNSGKTYDGMIHAVDWLPTLVEAAGGPTVTGLDGVSQWQSIVQGKVPSARTEFVYNFDEIRNNSAIRQGRFKLLQGDPGNPGGWYPPPGMNLEPYQENSQVLSFEASMVNIEDESKQRNLARNGKAPALSDWLKDSRWNVSYKFTILRSGDSNGKPMYEDDVFSRVELDEYQLYDLETDPTERNDVKAKYPAVFKQMVARMKELRKSLVPANFPPPDPDSSPSRFGGVWSPGWC